MAQNDYIKLFTDALETWEPLSDAECGRLVKALLQYKRNGQVPELSGNERILFPTHRAQIDRETASYRDKCERLAENGKKGGRPPKAIGFEEKQKVSAKSKKSQDKDQDKDQDKEKDGKEKTPSESKRKVFVPPTIEEVRAYCLERKNGIDPEAFVAHYTANGWVQGKGKPVVDWKACVWTWERRRREEARGTNHGTDTGGCTPADHDWQLRSALDDVD